MEMLVQLTVNKLWYLKKRERHCQSEISFFNMQKRSVFTEGGEFHGS